MLAMAYKVNEEAIEIFIGAIRKVLFNYPIFREGILFPTLRSTILPIIK